MTPAAPTLVTSSRPTVVRSERLEPRALVLRHRFVRPLRLTLRVRGPLPACDTVYARPLRARRGVNRLHVPTTRRARPLPHGRYLVRLTRPDADVVLERILVIPTRRLRPHLAPVRATQPLCARRPATPPPAAPDEEAAVVSGTRVAPAPRSSGVLAAPPHAKAEPVPAPKSAAGAQPTPAREAGDHGGGRRFPSWLLPTLLGIWFGGALLLLGTGELRQRYRLSRYRRG